MNKKQREQSEAVDTLKQWGLVDGSTVYAKVNKVSASGMTRNVSLYIAIQDAPTVGHHFFKDGKATPAPQVKDITWLGARALEWGWKEGYNGGIRVTGCGMDMLFHTVASLSYAMGYGALNQSNHDMHIKYGVDAECLECKRDAGMTVEHIGLKYRGL